MTIASFAIRGDVLVLGLITGMSYGLLGVGLVLVYRASRGVNFAQASVGVLVAAVFGVTVTRWRIPYWLGVPPALLFGFAIGCLSEVAVVRRLRSAPSVMTVVATLGLSEVLLLVASAADSGALAGSSYPQPAWLPQFGIGALQISPADTGILLLSPPAIIALVWFLHRTRYGLAIRAVVSNQDAARMAGVPVSRMSALAWGLAGTLSVFTALFTAPSEGFTTIDALGPELLLRALAAAVIARMTSISAALIAGLCIGMVEQVVLWNYPTTSGLSDVALFAMILLVLLLRRRESYRTAERGSWLAVQPRRSRARESATGWLCGSLGLLAGMAGFIAAAALPFLIPDPDSNSAILTEIICFALVGLSIGIITGIGGQLSLGQFAIAGVGAVVALHVASATGDYYLALGLAALSGGVAALVIGLPALRLPGLMLAVTSLAFSLAAGYWGFTEPWALGSGSSPGQLDLAGVSLSTGRRYYLFALLVFAIVLAAARNIWRGGLGRRLRGVRDNEAAARAFAVSAARTRLQAFVMSGAIAGIGGAVYAYSLAFVDPTAFAPQASIDVVSSTVLGGIGLLLGPLMGALYIIGVPQFIPLDQAGLAASSAGWLILILYFPGGLAQLVSPLYQTVIGWLAMREPGGPVLPASAPGPEPGHTPAPVSRAWPQASAVPVILQLTDLSRSFGGITAVDRVSLAVRRGETLGIIGPNGAGKTTLFELISGFLTPGAGSVWFAGTDMTRLAAEGRARLGVIRSFQDAALFPTLTVRESVELAQERMSPTRLLPSLIGLRTGERRKTLRASGLIDAFGLGNYAGERIADLSTGTRRITELACVVAAEPTLLLLDEPSSGIAQRETEALGGMLRRLKSELDLTMMIIEHDIPMVMSLADRVVVMDEGRIIASGTPEAIQRDPRVVDAYLGRDSTSLERSGSRTGHRAQPDAMSAAPESAPDEAAVADPVAALREPRPPGELR